MRFLKGDLCKFITLCYIKVEKNYATSYFGKTGHFVKIHFVEHQQCLRVISTE